MLEKRKKETEKKKGEDIKAEEIFADVAHSVADDAKSGAVFTKRRLRRQTTLREKQEAQEGS